MVYTLSRIACLAVLALAVSSPQALAESPNGGPDRETREQRKQQRMERREAMREKAREALYAGIELTDEQQQQIDAIREQARAAHDAWREENKAKFEAIREQFREARENRDREAMQAAGEQMRQLWQQAPKPRDHVDDVLNVLTPEQRERFQANMAQLQERMQQRREEMKDRREERREKRRDNRDRNDGDES